MAGNSRSKQIKLTDEAKVLKRLRLANNLSLKDVGVKIGKSHSTISHIENGRMDVPRGRYLDEILKVYGIKYKTFTEYVREYQGKVTPREEITNLMQHMSDDRVDLLLMLTKRVAEGKDVICL